LKKIRLVITGNPGVGKHTSAKIVAETLDAQIIDINAVAIDNDAILKKTVRGFDVDVMKLRKVLTKLLRSKNDLIIVGHLAPYVLKPIGVDMVAVLRRSPYELEQTFEKRGYDAQKKKQNVASEILGISHYDSLKTFGKRKVAEFNVTGRIPELIAEEIISVLRKTSPRHTGIDWLVGIYQRGDMQRFFEY
jgi:adenylate kinase